MLAVFVLTFAGLKIINDVSHMCNLVIVITCVINYDHPDSRTQNNNSMHWTGV